MSWRSVFALSTGWISLALICVGVATSPLHAQSDGGAQPAPASPESNEAAPARADDTVLAEDTAPADERRKTEILFLEDLRGGDDPPTSEPAVDYPDNAFFIPEDPDGGLLPSDEILSAPYMFERATVGLTYQSIRSLRQMELDYRSPTWPTTVDRDRMSGVIPDSGEENPALPDSTISFTYRLAPYVVDYGDQWQTHTPITWELLQTGKADRISYRDGLYDVERAMAGSLAAVGHVTEAEEVALAGFMGRELRRGIDDPLVQRSVLMLIRLYQVADRSEVDYYRGLRTRD